MWMGLLGFLQGPFDPLKLLLAIYGLASFLATAFAVNNYFDVGSDALNKNKENPFLKGCGKDTLILVVANQILALAILTFTSPSPALLAYLLTVVLGVAYSAPPFRLKRVAGLDVISHMLYFGILLFLFGAFLAGSPPTHRIAPYAATIGLYSAFLQLRNLEKDKEYDSRAGDTTLSVMYPGASKALLFLTGILSVVGSLLLVDPGNLIPVVFIPVSGAIGFWYSWERAVDFQVVASLSLLGLGHLCGYF